MPNLRSHMRKHRSYIQKQSKSPCSHLNGEPFVGLVASV